MPLEKITERILQNGRGKAAAIKREAEAKAQEIIAEAQKRADSQSKEKFSAATRQATEERKRILALAQLEARNDILRAKREVIEEAFGGALERLCSLSEAGYWELLKKTLVEIAGGGEEIILSSSDHKRIPREFLNQANELLIKNGKRGSLKFSPETRNIRGGFILKVGGVEINNSFESLVDSIREEIEPEVVEVLFGNK